MEVLMSRSDYHESAIQFEERQRAQIETRRLELQLEREELESPDNDGGAKRYKTGLRDGIALTLCATDRLDLLHRTPDIVPYLWTFPYPDLRKKLLKAARQQGLL